MIYIHYKILYIGVKPAYDEVGDYDTCACIGAHVNNTSEIGHFKMLTYDYTDGRLRLRFKLTER